MNRLRKAKLNEAEKILKFYQDIIDSVKGTEFRPKWNYAYPDLRYINRSIEKQELYICTKDDNVIASVALNNSFDPEYENIDWNVYAKPCEITIIHTFAIASAFKGNGIGREIFNQIKSDAMRNGKKTIRVDIIDGNVGALKVFRKFGFEYIDSVEIIHEAVGAERFHLYEHNLKK